MTGAILFTLFNLGVVFYSFESKNIISVLKEMGENDGAQDGLTEANVNHLTCYKKNEQMICGWTWEVLVRLVLAIVFGLSALLIDPFLRWVEGKRDMRVV